MLINTERPFRTIVCGLLIAVCAGCGSDHPEGFKSRFIDGDRTNTLIKEARNGIGDLQGVREIVDERFGDPQDLKGWSKLPIDFGGVAGTVKDAPASDVVKDLVLELSDKIEVSEDEPIVMQFITGPAAPAVVVIDDWNAESGAAALTSAMEVAPEAGDNVVVGAGTNLAHGRGLYMRHCSHCHGTSGDGNGPTAQYFTVKPRDYRHGVFKFTSTNAQAKVSKDDLHRVLKNGVPGTYMPSFVPLLKDDQLHSVVEYVRFLSMRGEFERKLAGELAADYSSDAVASRREGGESYREVIDELKGFLSEDIADSLDFVSEDLSSAWTSADDESSLITPTVARTDSLESRRRGRELFLSKAINCASCHGISGKGNGPQSRIYEKNPVTQELYDEPGLHDVWDNVNQPRNLTLGIYRGGRRPIDLFRRIHAGIKGSRMPSHKNLKHEEIWDLVNYVLSVPFEPEPGHAPIATDPAKTASL